MDRESVQFNNFEGSLTFETHFDDVEMKFEDLEMCSSGDKYLGKHKSVMQEEFVQSWE